MREKIVSGFYGALSWVVWAVTISGIFFLVFLLCTGHLHHPSFTVKSAVLAPAAVDDAVAACLKVLVDRKVLTQEQYEQVLQFINALIGSGSQT